MPYDEAAPALNRDLKGLVGAVRGRLARSGVLFRSASGRSAFPLDPIPRVISGEDWMQVKEGLGQRVRALNAFVADAYGERRIVAEGVVPERVIDTAEHYEPALRGHEPPGGQWVGIAGLDLARGADGAFRVLEDNLMTPSGFAYAVAARDAVAPSSTTSRAASPSCRSCWPARCARPRRTIASRTSSCSPTVPRTPRCGSTSGRRRRSACRSSVPADLRLDGDVLRHGEHAVDAVYRRSNEDTLDTDVGRLLGPAAAAGNLGIVNMFGCGVGDDKLAHAYVEDMVRFYLGQEPAVRSVPTLDLGRPEHLERALDTFDDLVVKPRAGHGGIGVMICPHAERADVEEMRGRVKDSPQEWVAQPFVELSQHPTLVDGEIAPRHVDLRPFVFMQGPDEARVLPGGLTRYAIDEGAMVVNSTQRGGFKDTWVMP